MLIRNVKSNADLVNKKNLQAQMLQIAIDNESLLESRVKDYKNPNKPPPIPPQYKTNAELQQDNQFQQKEVINNLTSIAGVDNILALNVSQELSKLKDGQGNFLKFNKFFPTIKKRIEEMSKYAYGVNTFINISKEVFEGIEDGLLMNMAGSTSTMMFNQAIGSGSVIPSGQELAPLIQALQGTQRTYADFQALIDAELLQYQQALAQQAQQLQQAGQAVGGGGPAVAQVPPPVLPQFQSQPIAIVNSSLGQLYARLYAIDNVVNSPLANDPDFVAVYDIIGRLCDNSPSEDDLKNIDIIEQMERRKIQKLITTLIKQGLPTDDKLILIINDLDPVVYISAVGEQQISGNFTLTRGFQTAYTALINSVKSIRDKAETLKTLNELKTKLNNLLAGVQGLQTKLQTAQSQTAQAQAQLVQQQQAQAQLIQQQKQAQAQTTRLGLVASQKNEMIVRMRNDPNVRERLYSNTQHPVLKTPQGNPVSLYNLLPYGPSLGLGDFRPRINEIEAQTQAGFDLRKRIIVEVRAFKQKSGPASYSTGSVFDGNGDSLINPDTGGPIQSRAELIAFLNSKNSPPLDIYLWKNYLNATKQLYLGCEATLSRASVVASNILRYTPQQMRENIQPEIDRLDILLDTDKSYDPVANDAQRLVSSQGFGLKKGGGYTIHDLGSDIKKFFGGKVKKGFHMMPDGSMMKDSEMKGGMLMCPQNHSPVMAKDGKMYGNRCKAQAGGGEDPNFKGTPYAIDGMGFMNRKIKIGKGIAVEEQPRYKTFGKYIIHIPYLENENVLNFKYPSMGSIPTLKPVSIDDNFKDFILDILNTGSVNQRNYDRLTETEKAHFNKVVKGAGLSNALKFKADEKIDNKKDLKRIDILVGEILAGNDNDRVKKEAVELIKKCVNNGLMTKYKGMDLLLQIE